MGLQRRTATMDEITCKRCGNPCPVDPMDPWLAYCYECMDYPAGFDAHEYQRDRLADMADSVSDEMEK